jgi:hypothetical protein
MAQTNFRAEDMIGDAKTSAPASAKKPAPAKPKKVEAPVVEVVAEEAPAEETE